MTTLNAKAHIGADGRLQIDTHTDLPEGDIDVTILIQSAAQDRPKDPKRLLRLAGVLKWSGDPMQIQREMRNEWPE